ncbi:hypothetical protein PENSUB_13183 [Penicillium subrubescens]|uniref:Helicase C-terminal domain-containing protein n=1 Tax=Penicillium subrubescens TaxID=1316194 RepID=A0A1Q5SSF0_9EURO|nr:hypothetical protein PENSUB_13183 [Penicillium subrubescens]
MWDFARLYKAWSEERVLPWEFTKVPYALVNPAMLVKLVPNGNITPSLSHDCFPFLFRACIMMRSMGDQIIGLDRKEIVIGAEIPPIKVMTVEVRYGLMNQLEHNARYRALIQALSSSGEVDDGANDLDQTAGRQNIDVTRQLALLGFNLLLDDFLRGVDGKDTVSEAIAKLIGAPDYGFTAFWSPIICWMVEMVLRRLGIRSVSITAAKSQDERNDAVLEFTTPDNLCQVMNTTYNCGGTGLNLYGCCSIVILLEPAPNFNLETQAIGRVHRIGQTRPQKAYRILQDHMINRAITSNNFRKMLLQLAAQYPDLFDQELQARVAELEAKRKGKLRDHKRADLLNNICQPEWIGALITTCNMQSDIYLHA